MRDFITTICFYSHIFYKSMNNSDVSSSEMLLLAYSLRQRIVPWNINKSYFIKIFGTSIYHHHDIINWIAYLKHTIFFYLTYENWLKNAAGNTRTSDYDVMKWRSKILKHLIENTNIWLTKCSYLNCVTSGDENIFKTVTDLLLTLHFLYYSFSWALPVSGLLLSMWVLMWLFKSHLRKCPFPQILQRNGFSPVWARLTCTFKFSLKLKALPHVSQTKGFSPVCIFMWAFRAEMV